MGGLGSCDAEEELCLFHNLLNNDFTRDICHLGKKFQEIVLQRS